MKNTKTLQIARAGIIASLYVGLSFLNLPLASGIVQVRIAEAFTLLPLLMGEAVWGVTAGCLIVNLISGCAPLDTIFGTIITLIAGFITYFVGRKVKKEPVKLFLGGLAPVFLNAIILPIIWVFYAQTEYLYLVQVLILLAGQTLAVYGVGVPLYFAVKKIIKD